MAKADDKTKKDEKKEEEPKAKPEPKPDVAKAKPEPKKDLPAAPPRSDPLWEPERYSKRPEIAAEAVKAPSPLSGAGEMKPKAVAEAAPVAEAAGKASTYKVPLGGRSVLAAYDDVSNQVVYMPVPMVTVPPTAHMMPPPHPAQNLPPDINAAMVNAFTSGGDGAPAMPASYQNAMAANAFAGAPMMTDPMPMGYPMMAMGPEWPDGPLWPDADGRVWTNADGQWPDADERVRAHADESAGDGRLWPDAAHAADGRLPGDARRWPPAIPPPCRWRRTARRPSIRKWPSISCRPSAMLCIRRSGNLPPKHWPPSIGGRIRKCSTAC